MTILKEQVVIEQSQREDAPSKVSLDESFVRTILFREKTKHVNTEPSKELAATKKLLKTLIMEAWNECI